MRELARLTGSPVVELNRAVAVAECRGAGGGAVDRRRRLAHSMDTTTCTRRGPSCCAGSGAEKRRAADAPLELAVPTPSGASSRDACASSPPSRAGAR